MNSKEALSYLSALVTNDPKGQEALAVLALLAATADDLANLRAEEATKYRSPQS